VTSVREQIAQYRHSETRACPGFYHCEQRQKGRRPRAEVEFLGRGLRQQIPSPPARRSV